MEKYNYYEAVCNDIRDYIDENGIKVTANNREEIEQKLNDDLWTQDSVTGNGSGSYTFSTWKAEENLCHNWDLLCEAWEEFGDVPNLRTLGAEGADVTIRCYLLSQCIHNVLDEIEVDVDDADEWFCEIDFKTMERISGYRQDDYSAEDGYQDFVDAVELWWNSQDDETKVYIYEQNK